MNSQVPSYLSEYVDIMGLFLISSTSSDCSHHRCTYSNKMITASKFNDDDEHPVMEILYICMQFYDKIQFIITVRRIKKNG